MVMSKPRIIELPFTFLVAGGRIKRGHFFDTRKKAEAFLKKLKKKKRRGKR